MTASRTSHSTSSNGCVPSLVKNRLNPSPEAFASTSRSLVATPAPPSCSAGKDYNRVIPTARLCPAAPGLSSRRRLNDPKYCGRSGPRPQHVVVERERRRSAASALGGLALQQQQ